MNIYGNLFSTSGDFKSHVKLAFAASENYSTSCSKLAANDLEGDIVGLTSTLSDRFDQKLTIPNADQLKQVCESVGILHESTFGMISKVYKDHYSFCARKGFLEL